MRGLTVFSRFNPSSSAFVSHILRCLVLRQISVIGPRKCNQRGMVNAMANFPSFRTRQSVSYPTIRDNNDRSGSSGGKPRKVPQDVSWTTMMQLHEFGLIGRAASRFIALIISCVRAALTYPTCYLVSDMHVPPTRFPPIRPREHTNKSKTDSSHFKAVIYAVVLRDDLSNYPMPASRGSVNVYSRRSIGKTTK